MLLKEDSGAPNPEDSSADQPKIQRFLLAEIDTQDYWFPYLKAVALESSTHPYH